MQCNISSRHFQDRRNYFIVLRTSHFKAYTRQEQWTQCFMFCPLAFWDFLSCTRTSRKLPVPSCLPYVTHSLLYKRVHYVTLISFFRELLDAHSFVLVEVERHINANSCVTSIGYMRKSKGLKKKMMAWLWKSIKRTRTRMNSDDDTTLW